MRYDMSRQEAIDRAMCKPGYTYNETLDKCLGAVGPVAQPKPPKPPGNPEQPALPLPSPEEAIQMEIASREATGEV